MNLCVPKKPNGAKKSSVVLDGEHGISVLKYYLQRMLFDLHCMLLTVQPQFVLEKTALRNKVINSQWQTTRKTRRKLITTVHTRNQDGTSTMMSTILQRSSPEGSDRSSCSLDASVSASSHRKRSCHYRHRNQRNRWQLTLGTLIQLPKIFEYLTEKW